PALLKLSPLFSMNICSKCYKDMLLKQEQDKLASSENEDKITNWQNGLAGNRGKGPINRKLLARKSLKGLKGPNSIVST
ncbi:hypothetical protein S245_008582, partial [Arachis hypogaea]